MTEKIRDALTNEAILEVKVCQLTALINVKQVNADKPRSYICERLDDRQQRMK